MSFPGISAIAFKSNWHESRWRVRNQSETSQKPVRNRPNATICSPPSLPLSLSLFPSLSLSSLALLLELLLLLLFLLLLLLLPLLLLLLLLLLLTTTPTPTTPTPTTPTPTPTPTPTTGITVSFPDRFRTAQFSFLLKYENECVHGRILLLVLLLLSILPLAPQHCWDGKHVSNSAEKQWYYKEIA